MSVNHCVVTCCSPLDWVPAWVLWPCPPTECCQCCLLFHFFFSNNFSTFSVFRFVVSGHLPYNSLFMCTVGGRGVEAESKPNHDTRHQAPLHCKLLCVVRQKFFCAQRLRGDQSESAKQTGGSTILVPGFVAIPSSAREC